jgi:hypothetical protein
MHGIIGTTIFIEIFHPWIPLVFQVQNPSELDIFRPSEAASHSLKAWAQAPDLPWNFRSAPRVAVRCKGKVTSVLLLPKYVYMICVYMVQYIYIYVKIDR